MIGGPGNDIQVDSEFQYQFASGIKTIAVIPVEPQGLLTVWIYTTGQHEAIQAIFSLKTVISR